MSIKWITPTAISDNADANWTSKDLSGVLTSGTVGIIVWVRNASVSSRQFGIRHGDSTAGLYADMRNNGQGYVPIGVNSSRQIDTRQEDNNINFFVVAEFDGNDETFEVDPTSYTPTAGAWNDVDIATQTGGETATGAFGEVVETGSNKHINVRHGDSTDDRNSRDMNKHSGFMTGVNSSEIFEIHRTASGTVYVNGWSTGASTWETNRTDRTNAIPSDDTFGDLAAVTSPADGAVFEMGNTSTGVHARAKGDTHNPSTSEDEPCDQFLYIMTKVDGSRIAEARRDAADPVFWEVGVLEEASGGHTSTGALTFSKLAMAGIGVLVPTSTGAPVFDKLVIAGTGDMDFEGTGALVLDKLVISGTGDMDFEGTGSLVLDKLVIDGTGSAATPEGTGTLIFDKLAVSGTGVMLPTGTGAPIFDNLVINGVGVQTQPGTGTLIFNLLVVTGTGETLSVSVTCNIVCPITRGVMRDIMRDVLEDRPE